ncbi:MAG: DUF1540 domain-containing protein [Cellulosilyticaceae bacterium]
MTKVACSVENCSYNNNFECYAKSVAIGGIGSTTEKNTCCGTFLNQDQYSNLAEHTAYKSICKELTCNVASCRHYVENRCKLDAIKVVGENPSTLYVDTDCSNFELS